MESNLVVSSFLELLDKLRNVFLQDLVFLWRDYSHYSIFCDTLFASPDYTSFAAAVLAAMDTVCYKDPYLVAIKKIIPSINEQLQSIIGVI